MGAALSPSGWDSSANACVGTGTPLSLYSNPGSTTFDQMITNSRGFSLIQL